MKDAIAIVLFCLGSLFLLAASALASDAEGAVPAAHAVRAPETAAAAPAPAADSGRAVLDRGRRLTRWLLEERADSISARMSAGYRSDLGGSEGVRRSVRSIAGQIGEEREVVREEAFTRMAEDHYYRIARYAGAAGRTVTVHWAWNERGEVVYLRVRATPQPASTGNEDYRTKTELDLPFEGEWYVFWGGREAHRNYHVQARTQRFAYDFVVLRDGASHAGDGSANEDYHCYGRPILAPAPGRVATVVDTVPDNVPGEMNDQAPPGNHVVLGHGNGEHSLLAHLKHGSAAVEEGERVERGQPLGACGNSGRSSEPHLHYHLQSTPTFGEGVGLPAPFRDYVADGEAVERGEPVRDQLIRPAP